MSEDREATISYEEAGHLAGLIEDRPEYAGLAEALRQAMEVCDFNTKVMGAQVNIVVRTWRKVS